LKRIIGWLHLEPLLAVVLWGGIYPGVKLGLRDIPALSFTDLRLLLAMVVLFLVSGSVQALILRRALWKPLLNAGLAQAVFQLFLIAGLQRTSAGNGAILLATAPLLTAGWLAWRGQGPLRKRQYYGLGLGFIGVGLVVQGGGIRLTWSHLSGDLLALGAAGAWAWYGLAIGPFVGVMGTVPATGWTMVVAAILFTPFSLVELSGYPWRWVSWQAWAGLIYGGTAGMVMAMALWGRAIHRLGPQQTMLYVYLEPVSAVVIAAAVLGEVLIPIQAAGALLTFLGVGLGSSHQRQGDGDGPPPYDGCSHQGGIAQRPASGSA
jgi:drug/metabolite transporter (DMT)-like permease